jgi:hypothetical protein
VRRRIAITVDVEIRATVRGDQLGARQQPSQDCIATQDTENVAAENVIRAKLNDLLLIPARKQAFPFRQHLGIRYDRKTGEAERADELLTSTRLVRHQIHAPSIRDVRGEVPQALPCNRKVSMACDHHHVKSAGGRAIGWS